MRYAECHPDRKHSAKGLCELCYKRKKYGWKRTLVRSTFAEPTAYQQEFINMMIDGWENKLDEPRLLERVMDGIMGENWRAEW